MIPVALVIFVLKKYIPKFKFKKGIRNNIGMPCDSQVGGAFSNSTLASWRSKDDLQLETTSENKSLMLKEEIKQSKKTNGKIIEIFAVPLQKVKTVVGRFFIQTISQ